MTYRSTHIDDDERDALAGVSASSSSARRSGQTADILIFQPRTAAASWALEDAIEPLDEDVFDLGSIAVRLVADWSLPRLQVFVAADPEGGEPDRLP
jgi:hypothetical protein